MPAVRAIALVALCLSATFTFAAPTNAVPHQRIARSRTQTQQGQIALTQAVEFQTVTNTETRVGTITETCTVKLTPAQVNGQEVVQQDKSCTFVVTPLGGTPPSNNNNNNNQNQNQNTQDQNQNSDNNVSTTRSQEGTPAISDIGVSTIAATATETTAESNATAPPAISEIGVSSVDATATESNNIVQTGATPAISEIGVSSVDATATTEPTQAQFTLTGALTSLGTLTPSSLATTPSAAAAQESAPAAAQVPGRKLEVLPIGLGVFAGISVIALIVVGLVTYERTKYRKAFRQRKLAEAGANMGYGGMAERT